MTVCTTAEGEKGRLWVLVFLFFIFNNSKQSKRQTKSSYLSLKKKNLSRIIARVCAVSSEEEFRP